MTEEQNKELDKLQYEFDKLEETARRAALMQDYEGAAKYNTEAKKYGVILKEFKIQTLRSDIERLAHKICLTQNPRFGTTDKQNEAFNFYIDELMNLFKQSEKWLKY